MQSDSYFDCTFAAFLCSISCRTF